MAKPHVTEYRTDPVTGKSQYRTRLLGDYRADAWSRWFDSDSPSAPAPVTSITRDDRVYYTAAHEGRHVRMYMMESQEIVDEIVYLKVGESMAHPTGSTILLIVASVDRSG